MELSVRSGGVEDATGSEKNRLIEIG